MIIITFMQMNQVILKASFQKKILYKEKQYDNYTDKK